MARHSFFCIDGHTCGNPVRLVAGGGPVLSGDSMLDRRAHFLAEYDWIRTGLMFEPRVHDMMSGSILYPPTRADCHNGGDDIERIRSCRKVLEPHDILEADANTGGTSEAAAHIVTAIGDLDTISRSCA